MSIKKPHYNPKPSIYNAELHIPLLYKLFKQGKSFAAFCAETKISKQTFYDWIARYPEFGAAFDIANVAAQAWWEDYGLHKDEDWDYRHWSTMMRNRFDVSEHRNIKIKDFDLVKTPQEQLAAILNLISKGGASGQEIGYLCNLVLTGIKVEDLTTVQTRLDNLESMREHKDTPKEPRS